MNGREELVRRLSLKRRQQLGTLSDDAFQELELAVRSNPDRFVDDDQERAFSIVVQALERMEASHHDDDLLDDEQFQQARTRRFDALAHACDEALSYDDTCADALVLQTLCTSMSLDHTVTQLVEFDGELAKTQGGIDIPASGDAWTDVFLRPRLRLKDVLSRACLNSARYRMAREQCLDLLQRAPLDALGARLTCALAMARLEDEEGFNWLDAREGRRGNAWFHLSRVLLMYKLDRLPAARRALRGYDQLCVGGAYALLQPTFVEVYLPDRPAYTPGAFEESVLAVHEADPVVADVPDFCAWACDQPGFLASAQSFCERNGLEWRGWEE